MAAFDDIVNERIGYYNRGLQIVSALARSLGAIGGLVTEIRKGVPDSQLQDKWADYKFKKESIQRTIDKVKGFDGQLKEMAASPEEKEKADKLTRVYPVASIINGLESADDALFIAVGKRKAADDEKLALEMAAKAGIEEERAREIAAKAKEEEEAKARAIIDAKNAAKVAAAQKEYEDKMMFEKLMREMEAKKAAAELATKRQKEAAAILKAKQEKEAKAKAVIDAKNRAIAEAAAAKARAEKEKLLEQQKIDKLKAFQAQQADVQTFDAGIPQTMQTFVPMNVEAQNTKPVSVAQPEKGFDAKSLLLLAPLLLLFM